MTQQEAVVPTANAEPEGPVSGSRLDGRPSAVVFDCDGVLVDTEPLWGQAERLLFARRQQPYTPADRALFAGLSVWNTAAKMAARFDEPGAGDRIAEEMLDAVIGLLRERAVPMAGVLDLLDRLAVAGIPTAVASNSPDRAVEASLGSTGLLDRFDVVVTADGVDRPKPDPEPYLKACALLGVDATRAVAIEDSRTGLDSARAAGMATIGVPVNPTDFPADLVVPDLSHASIERWISSWS
ncbi:MAG: HAD family phosphatase [Propionicimonas sp.]|uniref:HAD family hydrolase n=1 Tax=Propionicimonas sp. TaxID=1955623 RepID=UPI002B1F0698|nr:HAD family phosphatase [Propionicimonas sp.]MEA4944479.1 HAD family phosphatase [Propionicimonas sp.]MEA5052093.1 HAD family phosphatase [Propionicimonas sp.]MEA5118959.1 HAD family phosphatase [Propionicimonas sp.]